MTFFLNSDELSNFQNTCSKYTVLYPLQTYYSSWLFLSRVTNGFVRVISSPFLTTRGQTAAHHIISPFVLMDDRFWSDVDHYWLRDCPSPWWSLRVHSISLSHGSTKTTNCSLNLLSSEKSMQSTEFVLFIYSVLDGKMYLLKIKYRTLLSYLDGKSCWRWHPPSKFENKKDTVSQCISCCREFYLLLNILGI